MNNIVQVNWVMVFIFDSADNVLLLKRIENGEREPIKWGIFHNETYKEAALRESFEEAWLQKINNLILFKTINDQVQKDEWRVLHITWYVTYWFVSGNKPHITFKHNDVAEHLEYKWVSVYDVWIWNLFPLSANDLLLDIIAHLWYALIQK